MSVEKKNCSKVKELWLCLKILFYKILLKITWSSYDTTMFSTLGLLFRNCTQPLMLIRYLTECWPLIRSLRHRVEYMWRRTSLQCGGEIAVPILYVCNWRNKNSSDTFDPLTTRCLVVPVTVPTRWKFSRVSAVRVWRLQGSCRLWSGHGKFYLCMIGKNENETVWMK